MKTTSERTRRVLGLDGATVATGWGVIDAHDQQSGPIARNKRPALALVGYGVITARRRTARADRLVEMAAGLRELIAKYKPTEVAIEEAFFGLNAKTMAALSEV